MIPAARSLLTAALVLAIATLGRSVDARQQGVAYTFEDNELVRYDLGDGTASAVRAGLYYVREVEVDASETTAYVLEHYSREISVVDLASGTVSTLVRLHDWYGLGNMTLEPQSGNHLYLLATSQSIGQRFLKIDAATGSIVQAIAPADVGITDPGGVSAITLTSPNRLFAATFNTIYEVNLSSGVATASVGLSPLYSVHPTRTKLVVTSDETAAYVGVSNSGPPFEPSYVFEVDLNSGAVTPLWQQVPDAVGLALSDDEQTMLLGNRHVGLLSIDLTSPTHTQTVLLDPGMFLGGLQHLGEQMDLALEGSSDERLYVASDSLGVRLYDLSGGLPAFRVDNTLLSSGSFDVDPPSQTAYLPRRASLDAVDLVTGASAQVTTLPEVARAVDVSADGARVLVLGSAGNIDPFDGYLAEVDLATGDVTIIAVHPYYWGRLRELAYSHDEQFAYASVNYNWGGTSIPRFVEFDLQTGTHRVLLSTVDYFEPNIIDFVLSPDGAEAYITGGVGTYPMIDQVTAVSLPAGDTSTLLPSTPGLNPLAMDLDVGAGALIIYDQPDGITSVDVATGATTLLAVPYSLQAFATDLSYLNTSSGTDVSVSLADSATGASIVSLTFDTVTTPGNTTVESNSTGPAPPTGFQLADGDSQIYYDISTSVTFDGQVEICIDYSASTWMNEANLMLFHGNGITWEPLPITFGPAGGTICGLTDSFSPFAVFELQLDLDAVGLLWLLVDDVVELDLEDGIETSLVMRLLNAIDASSVGNGNGSAASTSGQLEAFINEVEAQSGQHVPEEAANALIGTAQVILSLV